MAQNCARLIRFRSAWLLRDDFVEARVVAQLIPNGIQL